MGTGECNATGQPCDVLASHSGVEKVYCGHFNYAMYRNQHKLQPGGQLGLYADFTITQLVTFIATPIIMYTVYMLKSDRYFEENSEWSVC